MITDVGLCTYAVASYTAKPTFKFEDIAVCVTQIGTQGEEVWAFPGSESLENWVRDLAVLPLLPEVPFGPIPMGFGQGALGLWQLLQTTARGKKIWFTGHSLGGALALLVAAMAKGTEGIECETVVTFGAPRVGRFALRDWMKWVPVRQYRHRDDAVPELPFFWEHVRLPLIVLGKPEDPMQAFNIFANHDAAKAYLAFMQKLGQLS